MKLGLYMCINKVIKKKKVL